MSLVVDDGPYERVSSEKAIAQVREPHRIEYR